MKQDIFEIKEDVSDIQKDIKVINKKLSITTNETLDLRARVEILEEKNQVAN